MVEKFVEQLECVVDAEASCAGAGADDALQLQAPVADGGAHAARHVDGRRGAATGPAGDERHGRRRRVSLWIGEAEKQQPSEVGEE